MNIDKKLVNIFQKIFKKKNVKLLKRINEEKWDSLIHVNLIIGIESELDIKFNSAQIESLNSFKSILNIIKKNINEKNS